MKVSKMINDPLKRWKLEHCEALIRKINGLVIRELLNGDSPLLDLSSTEAANLALCDVREAALRECLQDATIAMSVLTSLRVQKAVDSLVEALKATGMKSNTLENKGRQRSVASGTRLRSA